MLLTALVQSVRRLDGGGALLLDLEGHGREEFFAEVDLSRTVGWFTSLFPVLLELGGGAAGGGAQGGQGAAAPIPNKGIGYGVLRYMYPEAEVRAVLQALPAAGDELQLPGAAGPGAVGIVALSAGPRVEWPAAKPVGRRPHLLNVNGWVAEGRLHLQWSYSQRVHRRATVEQLAQAFLESLQALIVHCQSPEVGGFTPSDFPGQH